MEPGCDRSRLLAQLRDNNGMPIPRKFDDDNVNDPNGSSVLIAET